MLEFLKKFLGYKKLSDGSVVEYYIDGLGKGSFEDPRHYMWIAITIILAFAMYYLFRKYKSAGRTTVIIFSGGLFIVRLINQITRAAIGAEVPALRAFPWHLCTMMTFVLPIIILLSNIDKTKDFANKMKTPIFTISMMGGIITVIVGDYFNNLFLNFGAFEGMAAHMLLIYIPIICIATGDFKLEIKKGWQNNVGMLIMLSIATLANKVIFGIGYKIDTNYMFVERNVLPGNIGGDYFMLVYYAVYVIFFISIFGIPELYRYVKQRKNPIDTETEPKDRKKAMLFAFFLGMFGSHFFYMDRKLKGIATIALSITGISFILGIVYGIMYSRMSDEQFNNLSA